MPVVQSTWSDPLPAGLNATYVENADGTRSYSGSGFGPFFSLGELVRAYRAANPGAGTGTPVHYRVVVIGANEAVPADVPNDVVVLRRRT